MQPTKFRTAEKTSDSCTEKGEVIVADHLLKPRKLV